MFCCSFAKVYCSFEILLVFIQVYNQPAARESGGGYFPMAASNLCMSMICRGSSASF